MTAPGRTADGQPVGLFADLAGPAEAPAALAAGAEGVGLLRTESLAAAGVDADAQLAGYDAVFAAFAGRRVVVRVLTAGDDRVVPPLTSATGDRPVPVGRGLRALRAHPEVLAAQLAVIAHAAGRSTAEVQVTASVVTDTDDAAWFTGQARAAGLGTPDVMIGVPAAALTAGSILRLAASATVDTDDLARYTLAADDRAAGFGGAWHPAVLRLVELVGAAGSLAGKPVAVCGSVAADPLLAAVFVGLGVTALSMPPDRLAAVRRELARHAFVDCLRFADMALTAPTAAEARRRVDSAAE